MKSASRIRLSLIAAAGAAITLSGVTNAQPNRQQERDPERPAPANTGGLIPRDPNARPTNAESVAEDAKRAGATIDDVIIFDLENEPVDFSDVVADGSTVVIFHRGSWCSFCTGHMRAMNARYDDFISKGASKVVAISPELPRYQKVLNDRMKPEIEFFHDRDGKLAKEFGVLWSSPGQVERLRKFNGNDDGALPLAVVYIVESDMLISWDWINDDYKRRAYPMDILAALGDEDRVEKARGKNEKDEDQVAEVDGD